MDIVRITELQPKTYVEQGDYIAIDNQSDGTKKVQFTNLLDDTLSQENKIAPANVVGDEIATIRAAVGSPLKASTVAQMTDTNKIYVYVGSESGYTNGNWYYWNGSAWVSGGVYNSVAVVTDPTLTLSGVPADAKATGDEVTSLRSDITKGENALEIEPAIVTSLTFPETGVINWTNGLASSSSSYKRTGYISIIGLSKVIYPRMKLTNAPSSKPGIAFYNSQQEYISGESALINQASAGIVYTEIAVPNDAVYIRITEKNTLTDTVYLKTSDQYTSGVKTNLEDLINSLDMQDEKCINLFNMDDAIIGGYINASNGNIVSRGDHFYSYIPITEPGTFRFYGDASLYGTSSVKQIVVFTSEKEYKTLVQGTHFGDETGGTWYGVEFSITRANIDNGYAYFGVSQHVDNMQKFMVVKDILYPSVYYPYFNDRTILDGVYIKDSNVIGCVRNKLYNKIGLFFGDSICNGSSAQDNKFGWAGRIGQANSMAWRNYGQNGATICTQSGRSSISNQVANALTEYSNPDYMILEGGTNDADLSAITIGTFTSDDYSGSYDDTTFSGALETLIYNVLSNRPHTKFAYIVAQKMGRDATSRAERKQFFDRAIEICTKWGVPVLNLWDNSPLNPMIVSMFDSSKTSAENIQSGSMYTDGQHLTPSGYERLSPIIESWMRTL